MDTFIVRDAEAPSSNNPPLVKVTRSVLQKMAAGALRYPHLETGEALVGLALTRPNLPTQWIILETIPPSDVDRAWGRVEMGDDWQHAVFEWWYANWQRYRLLRRASYGTALVAKWDVPLAFLGDWHKQPGMVQPSAGDMRTGKRLMRQNNLDHLLLPIVNFSGPAVAPPAANTVEIEYEQHALRVDFWGLRPRSNQFDALTVAVVDDAAVPRLPPIAWYLADADRYDTEVLALENNHVAVLDITPWSVRAHPPLDIGWILHPKDSPYAILVLTPATYPHRAPQWRIVPLLRPLKDQDFFAACFAASSPLSDVLPQWNSKQRLIDGVRAIQERYR